MVSLMYNAFKEPFGRPIKLVSTHFAVKLLANVLYASSDRSRHGWKPTYSIPQVAVPARLLAIVGKALDVVKTVARHTEHL